MLVPARHMPASCRPLSGPTQTFKVAFGVAGREGSRPVRPVVTHVVYVTLVKLVCGSATKSKTCLRVLISIVSCKASYVPEEVEASGDFPSKVLPPFKLRHYCGKWPCCLYRHEKKYIPLKIAIFISFTVPICTWSIKKWTNFGHCNTKWKCLFF